jgi:hypothetical protein
MRARGPRKRGGASGTGGWVHTVKLAFFVALGFVRFVGESRPSSRRYPTPLHFGGFPGKHRADLLKAYDG